MSLSLLQLNDKLNPKAKQVELHYSETHWSNKRIPLYAFWHGNTMLLITFSIAIYHSIL